MDYADKPEAEEPAQVAAPTEDELAAQKEEEDRKLVTEAHERYRIGVDALSEWRSKALNDLHFLVGDQWDPNLLNQRETQHRPALTINRLPQFLRQITNEQRQAKPSITVNPIDSAGDIKTAEVLQGVVRNIEYSSNADAAYHAGGQSAAATGLGYWDVCAEYEDEKSFDQALAIRRIRNPHAVVMDPGAKELAGDDARWAIISTDISKAEWDATYPDEEIPLGGKWEGEGDSPGEWVAKEGVRIHEYRWIAETQDTLIDISGTTPVLQEILKSNGVDVSSKAVLASEVGPDFAAKLTAAKLSTRATTKRQACWAKIAGDKILERGEFAGRYLQLVRVVGSELEVDGKVIYEGIIRHAKDPQRMLNFFASSEAEMIALAPKAPWLMAEGQDEGYESEWSEANVRAHSRLRYRVKTVGGQLVPAPQRVMAEANVGAITGGRQQAAQDLNEVTGIYPTQFGAPAPEQSGRAILARQTQGQTSNFHFMDNLAQAIRYTGRILVDLIPRIYSGPRIMRILGEDGKAIMVPVNGHEGTYNGEPAVQDGRPLVQLDAGRYDVAVSMGPSYLSRRQQAGQQLLELLRVNPLVGQVASDKVVLALDIPGGQEIADRLAKMLPPEIRPPDEDKTPPPQVLAQQLQQSQTMIEQLTQALHKAHDLIDTKAVDNASKERIALINAQTELVKTAATIQSKDTQAMLDRTADLITMRLGLDGIAQPPDADEADEGAPAPQPQQQPRRVPNAGPGAIGAGDAGAAGGGSAGPGGAPGGAAPGVGGPGGGAVPGGFGGR